MQDVFLDAHVSDDRIVSHIKLWLLLGHVAIESTSLLLFEEKKRTVINNRDIQSIVIYFIFKTLYIQDYIDSFRNDDIIFILVQSIIKYGKNRLSRCLDTLNHKPGLQLSYIGTPIDRLILELQDIDTRFLRSI